MLKNISKLEHVIVDKFFQFTFDSDASIAYIKEALFQMQKYIGNCEDIAIANQKADENRLKEIEKNKEVENDC